MNKFVICILVLLITSCGNQQSVSIPSVSSPTRIASASPTSTQTRGPIKDISDLPVISLGNINRLKEIDHLVGHEGATGVKFSPDGATLASYGADGRIRLWDIRSGDEFATFRHHPVVMAIAFSPDGKLIASGGADKAIIVWDTETGLENKVFEGHAWGIGWQALDWSPDGSLIASGDRAGVVRVWDVETGNERSVLRGHQDDITGITFSPGNRLLLSGSEDATIKVWDVDTASEEVTLRGHTEALGDVAFSPDGSLLASISGSVTEKDNTVRLWQTENWEQIAVMDAHDISWYGDISFSPDETMLVSSGGYWNDNTMRIYDVNKGEQVAVFEGGADGIVGVAFGPDGRLIVTSTSGGSLLFWGVE
jgi:WD40 repeat protein